MRVRCGGGEHEGPTGPRGLRTSLGALEPQQIQSNENKRLKSHPCYSFSSFQFEDPLVLSASKTPSSHDFPLPTMSGGLEKSLFNLKVSSPRHEPPSLGASTLWAPFILLHLVYAT